MLFNKSISWLSALISCSSHAGANVDRLELVLSKSNRAPIYYSISKDAKVENPQPLDSALSTQLGSDWKLFVYFYLVENRISPPPYQCRGQSQEEIFCCKLNGSIGLDESLVKSCGLFFSPDRLVISSEKWKSFWSDHVKIWFEWLSLDKLNPATEASVNEMLQVLSKIRSFEPSYKKMNSVLANVVIEGTAKGAIKNLGSTLRVKTFTWDDPSHSNKFLGGFAGWTFDGSAIWARGIGTSAEVVRKWSNEISQIIEKSKVAEPSECVSVLFFKRYKIKSVRELPRMVNVSPGPLRGRYRVDFANGNSIDVDSNSQVSLSRNDNGELQISGTFDVNEFVGRVIDREANPYPVEAARAFGIVARTYLLQNAKRSSGCYLAEDSTAAQRVSANPPTAEALKVATWSDKLILNGPTSVRYHKNKMSKDTLAWSQAVLLANQGSRFEEILRSSFPSMRVGVEQGRSSFNCERLGAVEKWIKSRVKKWTMRMSPVAGYTEPKQFEVCKSMDHQPYSDSDRNVIFMRYDGDIEDQITAAHEYLHLAFKFHPNGLNENFIEEKAKELVLSEKGAGYYGPN